MLKSIWCYFRSACTCNMPYLKKENLVKVKKDVLCFSLDVCFLLNPLKLYRTALP